ncbi:MAG: glycosyltransferase [Phycisphaerales bacterium]|nr:glycosyltransferase [Phycisphaerales bacterium]
MITRLLEPSNPSPPNGWPRVSRPLRIAMIGWARLSLQGREGSGYNLSCSELAAGLALAGHQVSYMRSGMDYSLRRGMRIRPSERWRGIACYDLINSPNLSPASSNFNNMVQELESKEQSGMVVRWLDQIRAEVLHIHSLEGYGLDLVQAVRDSGRPVVITPHNYWYGCPQVDLLRHETDVCLDYDGGRACVGCLPPVDAVRLRRVRATEQSAFRKLGPFWAHTLRTFYFQFKPKLVRLLKGKRGDPDDAAPPGVTILPGGIIEHKGYPVDAELSAGFDVRDARAHSGEILHDYPIEKSDKIPQLGRSPVDQNERFLNSDVHLKVVNDYGRRRAAGIAALDAAALVTPPSRFVLDAMVAMGMDRERGRHVRLGQPHFDQINRSVRRSPFYAARPWTPQSDRPLRLAFWGTTRNNKGLEILVQAIPLLTREVRQRCHFLIRAAGWDWPFRKRVLKYPEVSFWGGYDPLHLIAGAKEFDAGILPHVWFENSPLVLLEFLHAGKFVISSRLGGPPEWIVEPGTHPASPLGNGLLFPGGDPQALAERITRLASGSVTLPSAQEIHAVSHLQSYPDHVREVDGIYRELLGDTGEDVPTVHVKRLNADGSPSHDGAGESESGRPTSNGVAIHG